ncbi:hypothetical protein GTA51_12850 [Desulfovibrio aerotolerans]|uniref:Uncharacterized protein n=1 Tax=Solidesulfovibrio aerotolerans TaxID=295255 RepID=A0A7C9IPE4_9BACT|nr:hypothetical protein [Solidesulfovibrio aerotolerans]MYL84019.1 hypothetical protein [Solidesulfovibrio aerotolerans]
MRLESVGAGRLVVAVVLGLSLLAMARAAQAAQGPDSLAGIRLGQTVESQAGKLVPTDADRAYHRPYLGVMPVAAFKGFRSGYVDYGLCAAQGRVVRIKMNYADDSLAFFNRILEALKKRYGEPKEWRGNAFGTLRTWKWSLKSKDGLSVSLILMHYAGEDGAFTDGNSIRIAATDLVREEEACHAAKGDGKKSAATSENGADIDALGFDWFLPQ